MRGPIKLVLILSVVYAGGLSPPRSEEPSGDEPRARDTAGEDTDSTSEKASDADVEDAGPAPGTESATPQSTAEKPRVDAEDVDSPTPENGSTTPQSTSEKPSDAESTDSGKSTETDTPATQSTSEGPGDTPPDSRDSLTPTQADATAAPPEGPLPRVFPEPPAEATPSPTAGTVIPEGPLAPIDEGSLSEGPAVFTDAYPPTIDNLSGRGLFNLPDPFPLAQLHLQLPVNTLRVLNKGDGRFEVNAYWANNFAIEDNVTIDAETYSLDLGGWYAVRSDVYVGASIAVIARDGGILDGLIEGFHQAFGLTDGRRDMRPRDEYLISVTDDNGNTRELDRGVGLGDLVLKTHWNVNRGDHWMPAVALETFATLPTSTNGFGSSGVDLGLSVSFYKTIWQDLHLYAVVGGTLITNARTEGIKYQKSVLQATIGFEYAVLDELSLIVQHMSYGALLREPSPLDKHRNYIAAGLKWEFTDGYTFEFSVVENLLPFENSSDLAFTLGFQFSL